TALPPLRAGHRVVEVDVPDAVGLLAAAGVGVTTMGRPLADDPGYAAWAAAAGAFAASVVSAR
ncbi:MAG: DUF3866 domain-containing protein, partial [Actinomycetota bacterium]|nr:DUF3866 domain-containing protein [Actinomycetota bacterium]